MMMDIRAVAAVGAFMLAAAAPYAHAGPEGLRNGKWEITYRTTQTGMKLSAQAAAKMTPEQRAQADAKLKAENGKEYSRTFSSCNRRAASEKAMLAVTLAALHDQGKCSRKPLEHTASGVELEITCAAPNASQAVFKYDAEDGEKVTSSTDEQRADGVKEHIEASAHWVGACSSHS
jgi:Protein of unknown function (DUF3617)